MSRIENSINNMCFLLVSNITYSILGFISRTVFIYTLGATYLGLTGLLQNVFGLLAISELGISTAIGFSLYKHLANDNNDAISALMTLYKKAYRVVGYIILILGTVLFFFLDFFIKVEQQPPGITYIYFLFLFNIAIGYFLSYKTTLISSDQKSYKLVPIQVVFSIITTVIQIIYLLALKNYLGFLIIQVISSVLLSLVQNRYITREYKLIDFNSKLKIEQSEKKSIKKNIGGLIIHRIGDFCVNSTDNIIISKFVSLSSVGIYSNYILLRNIVNGYVGIIFSGVSASLGNLIASEKEEKILEIFNVLFFLSFAIYSFEAVSFICLYNPFITLWIGDKYLFSIQIVLLIVFNNFITGLRIPIINVKDAAGIYIEDSWVPFAFSAINLIASIVLVQYFGVAGVILGTIIGSLLTADWYRPVVIYKKVFSVSVIHYFKKYILYILLGIGYMSGTYWLCSLLTINNSVILLISKCVICIIVPNLATYLLFKNTYEFKYLLKVFKKMLAGRFIRQRKILVFK